MTEEIHKILKRLPEMDWWGRQKIIKELLTYPEEEFILFLENGLKNHSDANLRNAAMEVYAALGNRGFGSLSKLLQSSDPEVRLFCVNVLCVIKDETSLLYLFPLIHDPDMNIRSASAEAMGKIGRPEALKVLMEALKDEHWVALAAVNAIGEIGGELALKILHDCLEKDEMREMAIHILERAGNQQSIQFLAPCLARNHLREMTVKAIIKIAEREHCRPRPEYFITLAHTLKEMYLSADPDNKKHAFIALCWLEDMVVVPHLIEGLKDDELLEYAIEGLLHIGKKAVCSIVDNMKQSEGRHRVILAKILNMLGEDLALLQFAKDDDPEVRMEVALTLGALRLERARKTLLEMLKDPHEEVRIAARKSLESAAIENQKIRQPSAESFDRP